MGPRMFSSKFGKVLAAFLAFVMVYSPIMSTLVWASAMSGWDPMLRGGVMIGNGDHETDYTADFLLPIWRGDKGLIFINPHLRFDDKDQNEENIGIGFRTLKHDNKVIYGGNVFFDSMDSGNGNRFNQIGVGFEALSRWVDVRANGYFVIGDDIKDVDTLDEYYFGSNQLYVNEGKEEALTGADAEIGVLVPGISDYIETKAYAGAFYYDSFLKGDIWGWKGRVEVRPAKFLNLMAEYKERRLHDDTDSVAFFGGYVEIPLGGDTLTEWLKPASGARTLDQRMTEKVVRDRHIRTLIDTAPTATFITNALFVNLDNETQDVPVDSKAEPTGPDGTGPAGVTNGTGSLEDPYWHTDYIYESPYYQEGALVYIFDYDNSQDDYRSGDRNGAISTITLLDDMILWGEGYYDPIKDMGGNGPFPNITGYNERCITIGNNNEVSGLEIQGCDDGIYGDQDTPSSADAIYATNIHDNIIHDNGFIVSGIHISNERQLESMNGVDFNFRFANNEIYSNGGSGIYLYNNFLVNTTISDTHLNTEFTNNLIYDNAGYGVYMENVLMAYNGTPASDIATSVTGSSISHTFTDNVVVDNWNSGIYIPYNALVASTYVDTYVDGNVSASVTDSQLNNTFVNNISSNNGGYGIYLGGMVPNGFGPCVYGNSLRACSYANGAYVTGDVTASVSGNRINNVYTSNITNSNEYDGIYEDNAISADVFLDDEPPTIQGSGVATAQNSSISSTFTGNTADNNLGTEKFLSGIHSDSSVYAYARTLYTVNVYGDLSASVDNADITQTFTNNQANDNNGAGIYAGSYIDAYANAYLFATIGGDVTADTTNSSITGNFTGNTTNGNSEEGGDTGIHVDAFTGATTFVYDSTVYGGMYASMENDAIDLTFTSNTANDNEGDGIQANAYMNAMSVAGDAFINGPISATNNDSVSDNTFTGNTAESNSGNGLYMASYIYADAEALSGSTVMGAVTASVDPPSITNDFQDNIADDNYDDNIEVETGIEADARADSSILYAGINSEVRDASILNNFENNSANGSLDDSGIDINDFDIGAYTDIFLALVNGTAAATVDNSSVTSSLTGNDVNNNYYENVDADSGTIQARVYAEPYGEINGDVVARVIDSGFDNIFEDNTIENSQDDDGVDLDTEVLATAQVQYAGVTGDVIASVDPSWINNEFTNNDINGNEYDNVDLSSRLKAEVDIYQATIFGEVSSDVEAATIDSTFTGNNIDNSRDGRGVDMNDFDIKAISDIYDGFVNGPVSSSVDSSVASATFTDNDISGNYDENVRMRYGTIAAYSNVYEGTQVNNSVSATVTDSGFDNTFTNNDISDSQYGQGVEMDVDIEAEVYAYQADVTGYVTATVDPSWIDNQFTGNDISGNEYDNVRMETDIEAGVSGEYVSIYNTVTAQVLDATVDNTFTDNDIDNSRSGDGVDINSADIKAWVDIAYATIDDYDVGNADVLAKVDGSVVTNEFTGNSVSGNEYENVQIEYGTLGASVDLYVVEVDGDVTAKVTDSGYENLFTNNDIDNSRNDPGVVIDADIEADIDLENVTANHVTASIDPSWVLNEFTGNSISGNDGDNVNLDTEMVASVYGDYLSIYNSITAEVVDGTVDNVFTNNHIENSRNGDGVDIDNADIKAEVYIISMELGDGAPGDGVFAYVDGSVVTNEFTDNSISGNEYENVQIEYGTLETDIYMYNVGMSGDVVSKVTDSGYENNFTNNDINNSQNDPGVVIDADLNAGVHLDYVDVYGYVTASVDPSWVTNEFTDNTITGNDGDNVNLDSEILAWIDIHDGSYIDNTVTAEVVGATLDNIFDNNTIDNSRGGDGVDIDNADIKAEVDINSSTIGYDSDELAGVMAMVDDSVVTNEFTDNSISGNQYENVQIEWGTLGASVDLNDVTEYGDVTAKVKDSGYENIFTNNTINYSDNDPGVVIDTDLETSVYLSSVSVYNGEVTSSIDPSWVLNQFEDNSITGNYRDNVNIDSELFAEVDMYYAYVENGVKAEVVDGTLDNVFDNNTIRFSENGDGVDIDNADIKADVYIYDATTDGPVSSTVDNSVVTNEFTSNNLSSNEYENVQIEYGTIGAYTGVYYSTINNTVTSKVTDSGFDNIFTGNTANNSDNDSGIVIDTDLEAEASVASSYVLDDITASIDPSWILNRFQNNTVNNNDGDGVRVDSAADAFVRIWDTDGIMGNVVAANDGTDISNIFTGNHMNNNWGDGADVSSEIISAIESYSVGTVGSLESSNTDSTVTNQFSGNQFSDNEDYGLNLGVPGGEESSVIGAYADSQYSYINNAVTATTSGATIDTDVTSNSIQRNGDGGVTQHNEIFASTWVSDSYAVGNGVSATNTGSSIENNFSNNTVDDNGDGCCEEGNGITSSNVIESSSSVVTEGNSIDVEGDVTAETSSASIDNNFANNSIDDNYGNGVRIYENFIVSQAFVENYNYAFINGNVSSETSGSTVDNTFTDNSIDRNGIYGGDGVVIGDAGSDYEYGMGAPTGNLIAAYTGVFGYVDVMNSVSASVDPVSINNEFDGNSMSQNWGDGITMDSYILAGALASTDVYVAEDIDASVADATIDNVLNDNTLYNNYWDGADIDSNIGAVAAVMDAFGTVDGNVSSSVSGSAIDTTFTDNRATYNDDGLQAGSTIGAVTLVVASHVLNSVTSDVSESEVTATVSGNTVDNNYEDGVRLGVADNTLLAALGMPNYFDATANIGAGSLVVGALVNGSITSNVTNTTVDYDVSDNSISGNDSTGLTFETGIGLEPLFYSANTRALTGVLESTAEGDVTSKVTGSDVNYGVSGNTITGNGYDGVVEDGAIMSDAGVLSSTIGGNVSAGVDPSGIYTSFTDNDISNNGDDGVDMSNEIYSTVGISSADIGGDVSAINDDTHISSMYNGNTIMGNASDGIEMGQYNETGVFVQDAWINGPAGTMSMVNGSSVDNAFYNNDISNNYDQNIDSGDSSVIAAFTELYNYDYETTIDSGSATSLVANSEITNVFGSNIINGSDESDGIQLYNEIYASLYADTAYIEEDAVAWVTNATIMNEFTDNKADGNYADGIDVYNNIHANNEVGDYVNGDAIALVNGSLISSAFTNNSASDNGDAGIESDSYMTAYNDQNYVDGIWYEEVSDSSIEESFTDNTVTGNQGGATGIHLYHQYGADWIENIYLDVFMQGNVVTGNSGDGVYLWYDLYINDYDNFFYRGDLGGGALGSTGGNWFFDNGGYDLHTGVGDTTMAEDNQWNSGASDPGGQIWDEGSATDYDPWDETILP